MVHPDDKLDLDLHRVVDNSIIGVQRQFGLSRADAIDRFEAFIELEREEEREALRAQRAIDAVLERESERA